MLDYDPLQGSNQDQQKSKGTSTTAAAELAASIRRKQAIFSELSEKIYDLWMELPKLTVIEVDPKLREIASAVEELAPEVGVSLLSLRPLRECCGKKRAWPPSVANYLHLADPNASVIAPAPLFQEPKLGWKLGDIVYRITNLLGFRHCPKCELRRQKLNALFSFKKG